MISEKEIMIVDAVNKSKGEAKSIGPNKCRTHVSVSGEKNSIFSEGEVYLTSGTPIAGYWNVICTIEKYNQCIREMSEGAFVPDAKPEFVYGQDVCVEDTHFSNKDIKFGCLTLKGDCAILLTGGGHMVYPLVGISSKPVKAKEEIELEEAKEKQVDDYSFMYSHFFESEKKAKKMFLQMQNKGELSEILLPLESK